MGEAVVTIPSILNKCLFVSPDRQTDGQDQTNMPPKLLRSWGHKKWGVRGYTLHGHVCMMSSGLI